jgi:hypothetical protein
MQASFRQTKTAQESGALKCNLCKYFSVQFYYIHRILVYSVSIFEDFNKNISD